MLYRIWPFNLILLKLKQKKLRYSTGQCPACKAVDQGEMLALFLTEKFLKNEKGLDLYKNHPSLCWKHLLRLLDEIPPELALPLIQTQIAHLKKLDEDLDEYSRKTDCRFSHEPKGEEQLAWLKSLRFYVGESFDTYK